MFSSHHTLIINKNTHIPIECTHIKDQFMVLNKMNLNISNFENLDSLVAKGPGCSCREPGFNPQHPHGGSHLPVILIPGDLKQLLASMSTRHTYSQSPHTH